MAAGSRHSSSQRRPSSATCRRRSGVVGGAWCKRNRARGAPLATRSCGAPPSVYMTSRGAPPVYMTSRGAPQDTRKPPVGARPSTSPISCRRTGARTWCCRGRRTRLRTPSARPTPSSAPSSPVISKLRLRARTMGRAQPSPSCMRMHAACAPLCLAVRAPRCPTHQSSTNSFRAVTATTDPSPARCPLRAAAKWTTSAVARQRSPSCRRGP